MSTCALCGFDRPLKESHIIPSFVFDRIKRNSPTGFIRKGIGNPNVRRQDGDKIKLLCGECEQRFSKAERKFAEEIFEPYHETGQTSFVYENWLSYFICSVNWRTLHLDNIGFNSEGKLGSEILDILDTSERILADFLIEKRNDIAFMENHILPMFEIKETNADIKEPNFLFRTSAFDYTFIVPSQKAYYVCANLAGVLIFTVISRGDNDVWENTKVNLNGGSIKQTSVHITSPLIPDMIDILNRSISTKISKKQKDVIIQKLKKNADAGNAKSVQYRKMDKYLKKHS